MSVDDEPNNLAVTGVSSSASNSSSYQCGGLTKSRHLRHIKTKTEPPFIDPHPSERNTFASASKKDNWLTTSHRNAYMQLSFRSVIAAECTFNDFKQVNGINSPLPENVFRNSREHNNDT